MTSAQLARVAHVLFHVGTFCLVSGLFSLGIISIEGPELASGLYGLPVKTSSCAGTVSTAWVQVAGLRDVGMAASAFLLYICEPRALRYYVPTLLIVPIGDAYLTLINLGTTEGALTHLGGVFAIGALTACAWLDPALDAKKKD